MSISRSKIKIVLTLLVLLVCAVALLALFGWYKFFREEPEQTFANDLERFKYGSIGAENERGLPYWIWTVLPSVFPDLTPGPGGYKSFGLVWEEGHEMPVGFTKRVIGFPRVANNCAICHVGTWRRPSDTDPLLPANEMPHVVPTAPSHTTDVQNLIRFLTNAAKDSRFNADTLLGEINQRTQLSVTDKLLYRFVLIPLTRRALLEQDSQMAWMNRPHWPQWGRGRDDPMNLTKYFMTSMPVDNSTGIADFPSVWNLKTRKGDGRFLNWTCDTPAVRSVLIDSALGLGAAPVPGNRISQWQWEHGRRDWFLKRMEELDNTLSETPPPKYPFPIDTARAAAGAPIYAKLCAECHDPGAKYTNTPIPVEEVKTDRERMDTWMQAAADEANRRVAEMGITRPNMVKKFGYCSPPLDGIWLRAPYLHNGSVPNMRELLSPEDKRTKIFYRGCDVYDPANMGFVTSGALAGRTGWRHDVSVRGDSNAGHTYGADLSPEERDALIEYLKQL
jgi:hypothetical protein